MNDMSPVVAAGIFVEREDGKILAFKRAYDVVDDKVYGFVGGYVDEGEDAVAAAIREANEESGIVVEIPNPDDCYTAMVTSRIQVKLFRAIIIDGHENVGKTFDETEGVSEWIEPTDIYMKSPFYDFNKAALEYFNKE